MKRRRLVKSCITRRKRWLENVDIVRDGNFSFSGGERGVHKIRGVALVASLETERTNKTETLDGCRGNGDQRNFTS